jgi:hypothetical protein
LVTPSSADLHLQQKHTACTPEVANGIGLDLVSSNITPYLFGKGGLTCARLSDLQHHIKDLRPDILLLECGSNDLCSDIKMTDLALQIHAVCFDSYENHGVRHIVWCKVLHRTLHTGHKSLQQYTADVIHFNDLMCSLIEELDFVTVWTHQGFDEQGTHLLSDGLHFITLPWSTASIKSLSELLFDG